MFIFQFTFFYEVIYQFLEILYDDTFVMIRDIRTFSILLSHKSTKKIGFQGIVTCKNTREELIKALPFKKA